MTDQQRIDFEAQGYLVLNLKNSDLNTLQTAYDQAKDHLEDLPNQHEGFIHLAEHPDIFPVVYNILSDEIQLRSLTGFTTPPNSPGRGWHRETASLLGVYHALSTLSVQVVIQLDQASEKGAGFMVVPGSHRFKPDTPFPDITYIQEMPHAVALPVKAGTVAILHGNLWQARTRNQSHVSQRFLTLTYVHCWMRHTLPTLSPQAIKCIEASPNLSQLFALRDLSTASGYWSGQLEGYPPSTGLPNRPFSPLTVVGREHEPNK